jgi:hypothetical protein
VCLGVGRGMEGGELAKAGGARQGHGAGWAPRRKMTPVGFEPTPSQSIGLGYTGLAWLGLLLQQMFHKLLLLGDQVFVVTLHRVCVGSAMGSQSMHICIYGKLPN